MKAPSRIGSLPPAGHTAAPTVKTRTVTVVDVDEAGLISIVHRAEWKRRGLPGKPSWAAIDVEIVLALVAEVRRLRDLHESAGAKGEGG